MSKTPSRRSVLVKHVGNEDVEHHVTMLGVKNQRKTRSSMGIAAEFFNDVPKIEKKKPSEYPKKKEKSVKIAENEEKDILSEITSLVPTSLLESNVQYGGVDVYGFKTPKRAKQMSKLASESARKVSSAKQSANNENNDPLVEKSNSKTPKKKSKTSKTPSKPATEREPKTPSVKFAENDTDGSSKTPGKKSNNDALDTPTRTSNRTKKYLVQEMQANQQVDNNSDSSEEENSEDEVEQDERQDQTPVPQPSKRIALPSETELYFEAHKSGRKLGASTSDRTLARLKIPQMNQETMHSILEELQNNKIAGLKNSNPHMFSKVEKIELSRQWLIQGYEGYFRKWMFYIFNDYNILLYGLGSKRHLVHEFCEKMLSEFDKIVINGYFPSLIIRSILASICEVADVNITIGGSQQQAQVDAICKKYTDNEFVDHLFLIIHNIDGTTLRNNKTQNILSRLASCPRIHVIATIDHINAPLIWDQSKLCRFKWLWYDVTTYEPYKDETSFEGSLLMLTSGTGIGGSLALSGLVHVARSLTPNARGIFKLLTEFQIEESKSSNYIGLSFSDLYQMCREKFLVNSELTLRTQLTEFLDHKLVEIKKGIDGGEYLSIPLDNATLQEYLDQSL
uniref:origin recognition complex subunit 2-like n=1 Tax=Styela clava TaxID=7725 RepID=UPI00193AD13C|nr:origin recognition complex subunit 2-like [Styela clava]